MKLKELLDPARLPAPLRTLQARRIAASGAAGLFIALVYVVFAPNWYQSTLTVVPATPAKSGALGAQIAGALGADLPIDLGNNADVERIAAVFESTSVTDAVIQKFDLRNRYDQRYIEHARKDLWSHCSVRIDRKAKLVGLTCEDRDPKFVKTMLEFFGDYGNQVFRRVSTTSASEEVRFLEQRVADMRREADDSARRMREFEERYKVVDLESQSKAVVSAMASLRGQEIAKELQLSYLNSFSARDESTAVQLRQQLSVMNAKFRALEESPSNDPAESRARPVNGNGQKDASNIFPPALAVPGLRFELEQLLRDRKIREADLLLLMQRLEMAKVNEARDTSAFQILDSPPLPTYKSRPRGALVVLAGLVFGVLLGALYALGPSYIRLLAGPEETS
jgi:capsule polysaccharide export protein KpsE/RkpR